VNLVSTCTSPTVDATLYRQLVSNLLYLTHTHLDLSFDVVLVAWYMKTPHEIHWKATKIILQYRYTFSLVYIDGELLYRLVSTNSNWANDPVDQMSTVVYVFNLG
jgi:hypothetical protein